LEAKLKAMGKEAQPQEAQSKWEKKPLVVQPPSNPAEAFVVDAADFASGKVTPFVDLDTEEGTCVNRVWCVCV